MALHRSPRSMARRERRRKECKVITDDDIEKALDFLRDNAKKSGELRGLVEFYREYRKSLKGILMALADSSLPVAMKEAYAYGHKDYQKHLKDLQQAEFAFEENRALREAAKLKIEAWQTQSANRRAMTI